MTGPAAPRRHLWRDLGRAVSWHRRKLAVLAAVAAVLSAVAAVSPEGPPTLSVVRAAGPLAGGVVLGAGDVELVEVVAEDAPDGAVSDPAAVVGRRLTAPVAEGQVLTGLALLGPRAAGTAGQVIAPMRLADADIVALLRAGEVVDVIGTDQQTTKTAVVAADVRVVTIPVIADQDGAQTGALVLVEVSPKEATNLARAAVSGALTVIWR